MRNGHGKRLTNERLDRWAKAMSCLFAALLAVASVAGLAILLYLRSQWGRP